MMRVLIVDDETDARFLLANLLKRHCSDTVELVGEADDVEAAVDAIRQLEPDVVLLDIRMRTGTGFDVLQQLDSIDFEVIFITAHDEFAIQAIDFSASAYLLKPVRLKDLKAALERVQQRLGRQRSGQGNQLRVLVDMATGSAIDKLVVAHMDGFQVLQLHEIVRMEADSNYTRIFLVNGSEVVVSRSLGEYDDLLNAHGFLRVHQKHLVNLSHVTGYSRGAAGQVQLSNGSEVALSRRRKPELLKRFL